MAQNKYKEFADKVITEIENDNIIKELSSKEQSKYIKSAIAIAKSSILVEVLKKFEGRLDLQNLSPEAKKDIATIIPIYESTVKAIDQANKILGRQAIATGNKEMEL